MKIITSNAIIATIILNNEFACNICFKDYNVAKKLLLYYAIVMIFSNEA